MAIPQPKLPIQFIALSLQQFNSQDNQAKNKDQQADAIDAMHITYPFIFRPVGILLFQVEIFCYLTPDAHDNFVLQGKVTAQTRYKKRSPGRIPGRSHKKPKLLLLRKNFLVKI